MSNDTSIPQPEAAADAQLLELGLELLESQHNAMLARDAGQLAQANLRLSEWIGRMHMRAGERAASGSVLSAAHGRQADQLGEALRDNALVAAGMRAHAARALDALVPSGAQVYESDGHKLTKIPERNRALI